MFPAGLQAGVTSNSPGQGAPREVSAEGIASVTSFIVEFNANAAIMEVLFDVILAVDAETQGNKGEIQRLIQRIDALRQDVDQLMRFGRLYRPSEDRSPVIYKGPV